MRGENPSLLHAQSLSVTESEILSTLSHTFLTRKGCHICAVAEPLVRRALSRSQRKSLQVVDIDSSDELVRDYGLRVPVLLSPSGEVVIEGPMSSVREVKDALRRSKRI